MHLVLIDVQRGRKRVIKEGEKGVHTAYGRISRDEAERSLGGYLEVGEAKLAVAELALWEAAYAPKKFRYATQIVYPEDRGTIVTFADIRPGKIVLEAGTGSGFLAAYLTRHSSFVYTYEKREEHYKRALENLKALAREGAREARLGDVSEYEGPEVDAIVLDLPNPWEVIPKIYDRLKPGGRICVLVPTYNQVERTLKALLELGFVDVFARESLVRDLSLKPGAIRPVHRGITFRLFTMFARRIKPERVFHMQRPPDWALRMFRAINEGTLEEELERISAEPDDVKRLIYLLAFAKFTAILWGDLKDHEGYDLRRKYALEALRRAEEVSERLDEYRRIRNILHQADIRMDFTADYSEYIERMLTLVDSMDEDQLLKASVVLARAHMFKESYEVAMRIKDENKRRSALGLLKFKMLFG